MKTLLLMLLPSLISATWPFSSCQFDTHWMKGSGPPIESFVRSVVPNTPFIKRRGHHDLFASFTADNKKQLRFIAKDARHNTFGWRRFVDPETVDEHHGFDGWLFGWFDDIVKKKGSDLLFIFPDFRTGLRGQFGQDGFMISARRVLIKAYR